MSVKQLSWVIVHNSALVSAGGEFVLNNGIIIVSCPKYSGFVTAVTLGLRIIYTN